MSDLEQRIATLEAIEAIKVLKAKYFFSCDSKRPDLVRECFADGVVDLRYGRVGDFTAADDMVGVFQRLACEEHIVEMHHAQNPQITLQSSTQATATWGLFYFLIDTKQQTATQLGGFYEDGYRCVEGDWKISRSVFNVTSTYITDVSNATVQMIFAGRTAPVEIDDPARQAKQD
jgi:hypothetical protein